MSNNTTPSPATTPTSVDSKVPLQPAKPAPGADEKHARIDKAMEDVTHKDRDNRTY